MNIKNKFKSKELVVFHPSIEGAGVEKNLYLITNYLSQKIKKVSLITCDEKKNKFSKKVNILRPFFNVSESSGRPIKYFLCILYLTIYCILKNNKFVVLSFQANIYAIIICKIFNIKIISRSNSSPSGWSKNFLKNIVFNFFLKKADEIIVNSVDFKNELDKKFNLRSILILNPFNFKEIKRKSKEKVKNDFFEKSSLKILNVARLTDQKDHLTLLKAINIVKKYRKIQLIVVGRGVFKDLLLEYIRKNNLNRIVKLVGFQENPFKFMKLCDVFVLSSIFEGHPNVLVEALSLKRFVISTNCPTGPKEILGDGKYGILFKTQNYNQLAKILTNFKLNNSNKKKIQEGYKTIKIYDHIEKCEAYLKVLKKYI